MKKTLEQLHEELEKMPVAEKVRSANDAAFFGIYEYSPVPAAGFSPWGVTGVHVTERDGEFSYLTAEGMEHGDYTPAPCPAGTALHLTPSVTCWRVGGFVLPDGRHYVLSGT